MALTDDDLAKIAKLLSHELNGKMDKKFDEKLAPVFEEFAKMDLKFDKRFDRIEESIDANARNIQELMDGLGNR
ncbi:MAG: hypothetical protein ACMVP2_03920 [Imperialibacter sp.]|uniref:hypothetical protein n=1 Tax=Imperialibacter sp. TaxID=2038411 RepID=UPI003A886CE5